MRDERVVIPSAIAAADAIEAGPVAELCAALVRARSENPPGKEAEPAELIADWGRALGAEVTVSLPAPARPNVLVRVPGAGRAPGLAFSGHTDVVPVSADEAGRWTRDPFGGEIAEGAVWGRGSVDMKGGIAAAMTAIEALCRAAPLPGDLWLLATIDEEAVMLGVKDLVAGTALDGVGGAIVCEPTSLTVANVCKGRTWATLRLLGRTAHASLRGVGVNAIEHAVSLAAALQSVTPTYEPHPLAGHSWWQSTELRGGIEPAIIPDRCELTLDARLVPGQTCDRLWQEVQAVIDRVAAETEDFRCEVEVIERREPWETPREDPLVAAMAAGVATIAGEASWSACPGTTDASYLGPSGTPCVICGPGDIARCHREDELVEVEALGAAARAYAHAALRYFDEVAC